MITYLCMKYESNAPTYFTNVSKRYRPETSFRMRSRAITLMIIGGFVSIIELDLYFMITYLCMKYESNAPTYSKDITRKTFFHKEIKGHNSANNWLILSVIKLDLHFMIIYLCMKYESISPMYSKDIARKPFFVRDQGP